MKLSYNETTLPNGLRVVTSEMPHIESTSIGIWAGVGGRYESLRSTGLSHFIEHLLFKGTERRNAREISQDIEGRGGYFNAFTQEESTCYYARITSEYANDVLDILADMYLNPVFDQEELDKERGVIVEEIMMYRDQPHQHIQDMLGEILWNRHALGRPLIGTPENIRRVPRQEIVDFKNRKYVPANTVVAMAGKLNHEACVDFVQQTFEGFKKKAAPKFPLVSAKTPQISVAVLSKP
ncbi:MAG: pitrilysin family protein, partial [Verrucomicrobiota bacterium]